MRIIGHEKERQELAKRDGSGIMAQSYLFAGPRGIGKSLCALEFAANLCGESEFVPSPEKPTPYDVKVLRPEETTKQGVTKTKNIPAESVREALSFLSQYPARGAYRVLIIEDAHRLSETAQNVLLKTLEEPVSTAVIILVTHEVGTLLPTVLSRVKRAHFNFVPEAILHEDLGKIYPGRDFSAIAPFFFALGRPGMILSAIEHQEVFSADREYLGQLFRLSTLSVSERLTLAQQLGNHTEQAIRLLEWWLPGLYQQAVRISERKMTLRFFRLLADVEQTMRLLKTTQSNTRLLLEKLFLSV